ncbi:MAG: RlmF-related methyltransferase [Candidatus Heimdallarchaeota archaeon]|nr:RlmF-related methyltransferase [Candidatus Heimdallarchaeota archaeon]
MKTIDIRPWCVRIEEAAKYFTPLQDFMDASGKIDLGNPDALVAYNKGVLGVISGLQLDLPQGQLIPTICLRHAYLKVIQDYLPTKARLLEIGTGSSALMSMLAVKIYQMNVVATELSQTSIDSANHNISLNNLGNSIQLIKSNGEIIDGLIEKNDNFDVIICYPPTYPDSDTKNFQNAKAKGFQGTISEMIGGGDDGFEFIRQYLKEAITHNIAIITVLCIFEDHAIMAHQILSQHTSKTETINLLAGTRNRFLVIGIK